MLPFLFLVVPRCSHLVFPQSGGTSRRLRLALLMPYTMIYWPMNLNLSTLSMLSTNLVLSPSLVLLSTDESGEESN